MYLNKNLSNYSKIKNTKFIFLLVSLFLTPINASTNFSFEPVINNTKIPLSKDKINKMGDFFKAKKSFLLNEKFSHIG